MPNNHWTLAAQIKVHWQTFKYSAANDPFCTVFRKELGQPMGAVQQRSRFQRYERHENYLGWQGPYAYEVQEKSIERPYG
jgi:hypothetical protein